MFIIKIELKNDLYYCGHNSNYWTFKINIEKRKFLVQLIVNKSINYAYLLGTGLEVKYGDTPSKKDIYKMIKGWTYNLS